MKKLIVILMCVGTCGDVCIAQSPFADKDSLDINNVTTTVLVHGDMWHDPTSFDNECYYNGSMPIRLGSAGALWMSGYGASGQLHVSAQTYRQIGNDYWPGPLNADGTLDLATSTKWAKVWKVRRAEINTFRAIGTHTTTNTPQAILTWPGKGSVYAGGKDGAALTVDREMAPFVDVNSNGVYEPLLGEYPDFDGDEALWCVYSDNGPTHDQTNGLPMKLEVRLMVTGYKRGTAMDNVVYYQYKVTNRSGNDYHDFRMAQWDDGDMGYYANTHAGFDSAWRMGIYYSDTGVGLSGVPVGTETYNPPVRGMTIVVSPGDVAGHYEPAGSYMYYTNDASVTGNPTVDTEYAFYMRSRFRSGVHLCHDATSFSLTTGAPCNYVFTDGPEVAGGWNECTIGKVGGERKTVMATNDFVLPAGGNTELVMAMVVDTGGGGCPGVNFDGVRELADTAWYYYAHPPADLGATNWATAAVSIFPNPASHTIVVALPKAQLCRVRVCDVTGKVVYATEHRDDLTIDLSNWCAGVYVVGVITEQATYRQLITKQ